MPQTENQLEHQWSQAEKHVARQAFDRAYEREIAALIDHVRDTAGAIASLEDLWQLHDFLSARRHDLEGKYDYQYAVLIFVFARLVKEGWLSLDELVGLAPCKLTKISVLMKLSP